MADQYATIIPTTNMAKPSAVGFFDYDVLLPEAIYAATAGSLNFQHNNTLEIGDSETSFYTFAWSAQLAAASAIDGYKATLSPLLNGDVISLQITRSPAIWRSSTIVYTPPSTPIAIKKVLCVGDSLTAGGEWPTDLATLLPTWTVMYEGHGGYSYSQYLTTVTSPMRHGGVLDIPYYLSTLPSVPDLVIWFLGINDIYTLASSFAATESAIDTMFANLDIMWAAWAIALPSCLHFATTTPPPNYSEHQFTIDYGGTITRTTCNRAHAHLIKRLRTKFQKLNKVIPIHPIFDSIGGYVGGNALHPGITGYQSIADQIFAFLKWRFT